MANRYDQLIEGRNALRKRRRLCTVKFLFSQNQEEDEFVFPIAPDAIGSFLENFVAHLKSTCCNYIRLSHDHRVYVYFCIWQTKLDECICANSFRTE